MSCHEQESTNNYFVDVDIPFSELMKKEVIRANGQWITPMLETGEDKEHDTKKT